MTTRSFQLLKFPIHLYIGAALIAVAWPIAWLHVTPFSYFSFLYLWLGYILIVDALNVVRRGSSLLTRAPWHFLLLFVLSAPVWWLFEFLNNVTQNWHYLGGQVYGDYSDLVATVHFTTVIPAVFETWELVRSFEWVQRAAHGRPAIVNRWLEVATFALGWVSLACLLIRPSVAFGLIWMWLLLVLDPLNAWLGRPSLIRQIARGDWRNVLALATAGLICGFCWEMWNYFSYPKWYYTVPHVGFLKFFEMPLLGYLGYIPFTMELYAIYHFVMPAGLRGLALERGSN
jgi:hypothetical protein